MAKKVTGRKNEGHGRNFLVQLLSRDRDTQLIGTQLRREMSALLHPADAGKRSSDNATCSSRSGFNLRLRQETRQLPVYDLALERNDGRLGPRLKPSDGTCLPITAATGPITDFTPYCRFKRFSPTGISAKGTMMEGLAGSIAFLADLQRLVRDQTGLSGAFDFDLEFAPLANTDPQASPVIFTAIKEQLGLQLRSATGPVDVFVMEQVERPTPD